MATHIYQPLKEHPPLDDDDLVEPPVTTDPFCNDQRDHVSHMDAAVASRLLQPNSRSSDDEGDSNSRPRGSTTTTSQHESTAAMAAFFTAALLGISTHFTAHTVGPLKDVLKENMGISNTQFSLLQSSLTLFPTIVPLIGGLLVERYGTGPSSIVFSSVVVLAQVVVILGCWIRSVKLMIIGFCVFGVGAAPILIIQETIWVRYFKDRSLALALALGLTTGKLAGFTALAGAYPLSTLPPFGFVTPFLISLIIACLAWVMNIMFLFMVKKPDEDADTVARITILLKAKRTTVGWREVYRFSSMFWTLLTMSFLFGASWNPFMHQASSIIKHRYDLSDQVAAWEASIALAVPLIVYPFLGTFIDAVGKRAWLLLATALLLIGTHVLILIPYSVLPVPPSIPMLLFALSLAVGTLAIVTSMPILTRHVPTGLGLHRSIDNIGATLIGTLAGMMQDIGGNEGDDDDNRSISQKIEDAFDRLYHHIFPSVAGGEAEMAIQEREDVRILCMFLTVALVGAVAAMVFVWGDSHWTDNEDGSTATGLVNAVYKRGKPQPVDSEDDEDEEEVDLDGDQTRLRDGWQQQQQQRRGHRRRSKNHGGGHRGRRRRLTRRSHEVLEAMMSEPIFDLNDEPDAEEVSMLELNRQAPAMLVTDPNESPGHFALSASGGGGPSSSLSHLGAQRESDVGAEEEEEGDGGHSEDNEEDGDDGSVTDMDDTGPMLAGRRGGFEDLERRYSVRIDNGERMEIHPDKKRQTHFWIMFWISLLVTSWVVFGIGMTMR